ncbi:MAG: QueT transporter family protein [Lachnospiraceae bacterium]
MMNKKILFITQAAMIAAVYIVLTYFISAFNLASGSIQIRISEVLTVLPYFTPAAVPGLFIGCFLSNVLIGSLIPDIIFGSIATLIGAIGTYLLRNHKFALTLPPVAANMLIVPFVLKYAYGVPPVIFKGIDLTIPFLMVTVGIGEVISCCILGTMLVRALGRYREQIFGEAASKPFIKA